jgi:peptide/nickel transport system permease protein
VTSYILGRLAQSVVTLLLLTLLVFFMLRLLPGDAARAILPPGAPESDVLQMRQVLGLDQPLPAQYVTWLGRVLRGDFGNSLQTRAPLIILVQQRLPATLELAAVALTLATAIGIPLGLIAALKPGTAVDVVVRVLSIGGFAIPNFWLAIMLILVFGVTLHILPTQGYGEAKDFVLPSLTLMVPLMAILASIVRGTAIDVLREDYIRTAFAKGLPERVVVARHVLKNTFIQLITIIGLQVAGLMGGAVIIETVFAWPGLGLLTFQAVNGRDYPLVQAMALFAGITFLVVNLIVDLLYAVVDPRIRYT